MDNLYFKKLPSDKVPTVSGSDVVLVETASGDFMLVDSGGAKVLVERDKAFGVGTILMRANDISPASDLGGTWEKIAAGQTIIGASDTYPLNSEGGEATHKLTEAELAPHVHEVRFGGKRGALLDGTNSDFFRLQYNSTGIDVDQVRLSTAGGGQPFNIMGPYIAKNIWQRIA